MGLTESSFLERMEEMGFTVRKNHADHIRAMTDHELAKLLTEAECPSDFGGEKKCKDPPPHISLDSILCRECWLEWLRQEE